MSCKSFELRAAAFIGLFVTARLLRGVEVFFCRGVGSGGRRMGLGSRSAERVIWYNFGVFGALEFMGILMLVDFMRLAELL